MLEHVVHEMLEHVEPIVWVIAREQINFTEDLERVDDGQNRHEQDGRGEECLLYTYDAADEERGGQMGSDG